VNTDRKSRALQSLLEALANLAVVQEMLTPRRNPRAFREPEVPEYLGSLHTTMGRLRDLTEIVEKLIVCRGCGTLNSLKPRADTTTLGEGFVPDPDRLEFTCTQCGAWNSDDHTILGKP
jgi:hypothetical protein